MACDWSVPWLRPYQAIGEPVEAAWRKGCTLPQALNNVAKSPVPCVHFVPQSDLPAGQAYEDFIFHSKQCPTREGVHDFFNGLCWLHWPQTKARLNQLQATEITVAGVTSTRGRVRDAITLFDENAAILFAPPELWTALVAKDWTRLFVTLRPLWQHAQLLVFGHALLEKLVSPRKPMVAHVYIAQEAIKNEVKSSAALANIDAWLAADLSAHHLATKPFAPLPVLGVPGWWAANEAAGFYDDVRVFRPPFATTNVIPSAA